MMSAFAFTWASSLFRRPGVRRQLGAVGPEGDPAGAVGDEVRIIGPQANQRRREPAHASRGELAGCFLIACDERGELVLQA